MLILQLLLNGLQTGAIYALTAAGFALIFGATRIFHFAHGTAFTLAGYAFLLTWQAGWPAWISPIVMTSASGRGSAKKSPPTAVTRSLSPAASIVRLAIGSTTGRSKLVQRMWGWRLATLIDS